MRTFLVLAALAAVLAVPASSSARAQSSVAAHVSKYGRILFDGRGFVLYSFARDPRGRSTCAGACAKKWPPYIVAGRPAAGVGARASLLGAIRRSDGSLQATYAGRPLYYYVNDKKPGRSCARAFPCSAASGSSCDRTGTPFADHGSRAVRTGERAAAGVSRSSPICLSARPAAIWPAGTCSRRALIAV